MNSSFSTLLTLSPTMALKLPIPFPIFAPQFSPNSPPSHHPSLSELRFSRWNNANAEKFEQHRRSQQEIEDEIRRQRRFDSAKRIANLSDSETSTSAINGPDTFRSVGTPSSPSNPSIPGRKSKYSKNPNPNPPPPFRRVSRVKKTSNRFIERPVGVKADVSISEDGVSYVIDGAPFEFKYSYTETPKVKPIKLREPAYAPFGPTTMPRPWTGRAPLPPSKKKLPEFDSFQLPPRDKKGIKPVQAPGPFLPGSGPKYVQSREEILGEPLTAEEIKILVQSCIKSSRQMNIGRDGLTHNMLDNIHSHWKRRRVCKIKCKGVCTVDMDNVKQQLEEKTGGKIIYSKGGTLYLYRGRNYNYRTRPRFPLMLWKPAAPVYPRLVKQVPEGLTLEEATVMRKKGRNLIPICKLGKNGVYYNLVKHVREAFEECELVRINCEGLNASDFKKIGAKLRDLVPCVLISFESEHILMWRGRDWKSSLPPITSNPEVESVEQLRSNSTSTIGNSENKVDVEEAESIEQLASDSVSVVGNSESNVEVEEVESMDHTKSVFISAFRNSKTEVDIEEAESMEQSRYNSISVFGNSETKMNIEEAESMEQSRFDSILAVGNSQTKVNIEELEAESMEKSRSDSISIGNSETEVSMEEAEAESMEQSRFDSISAVENSETKVNIEEAEAESMEQTRFDSIFGVENSGTKVNNEEAESESMEKSRFDSILAVGNSESKVEVEEEESTEQQRSDIQNKSLHASEASESLNKQQTSRVDGVLLLLKQAIENGSAVVLEDESSLDSDIVYQRTVAFAQTAPPGPVFRHQPKRVLVVKSEEPKTKEMEVKEEAAVSVKGEESKKKKGCKPKKKENFGEYDFTAVKGSLAVDELAKLLA